MEINKIKNFNFGYRQKGKSFNILDCSLKHKNDVIRTIKQIHE